jgi:hypothetical protein
MWWFVHILLFGNAGPCDWTAGLAPDLPECNSMQGFWFVLFVPRERT